MNRKIIFPAVVLVCNLILSGCRDKESTPAPAETSDSTAFASNIVIDTETDLLIKDLAENGDYVNSREFPSLIKASVVYENLDKNNLIIDLRPSGAFAQGHIKGSVNKRFEDLPGYFETGIKPFEYEKIVLVCDDGQISSYTASLLRLMGYGNVFAMRWGMSAWNEEVADHAWMGSLSAKYEGSIETKTNEKPVAKGMPVLGTGLKSGAEIATERFKKVFSEGTDNVLISADDVFADPHRYYVINYERKDKYDDAHIPGAVRYKPNATLGFTGEMATIPVDKTVVVYCGTGHNSGFATAYLRLLGYDARTLRYGNNGFMYNWMVKDNASLSWLPFSKTDVNDFALVQ